MKRLLIPMIIETLKMFNVSHFSYQYGKTFDIEWLKNLVLDRDYVNVMKVKNNDVTITKVTLSKQLQIPLHLSDNERVDLVAFLKTLSDNTFISNPKYAEPVNQE